MAGIEQQPFTLIFGPFAITNINANTEQHFVYKWPKAGEIISATVSVGTAITGADANTGYIKLVNATNSSAVTNVAVFYTNSNSNLAANTPTSMTETEFTFATNDILGINFSGTNAAPTLDNAFICVTYVYGNPGGVI